MAHRFWNSISIFTKFIVAVLALALSLVAGGGVVQTMGFLVIFPLWAESLNVRQWIKHPPCKFLLPVAAISSAAGIYYGVRACLAYDGLKWDLLNTRDWNLLTSVVSRLWSLRLWVPLGSRWGTILRCFQRRAFQPVLPDCCVITFLALEGRRDLSEDRKFILSASVVASVQISCAVILGILVARAHYFFVGRIFIYVIVLRAVLVVCGDYVCFLGDLEKGTRGFSA